MNDQFLIYHGSPVKSLGGGKVSGRVVTFSGPEDPDRAGDFFDDERTDFWLSESDTTRPILYRHGLDATIKLRRFGSATLSRAADGLWVTGYIPPRDKTSRELLSLAEQGELNWSSGSVSHLVRTTPVGKSRRIDSWPLAEISLCPHSSVAEPRNLLSLKSFIDDSSDFDSLIANDCEARAERAAHEFYGMLAKFEWERHQERMREIERGA
ncbi:MAG: hypothetical protein ABJA18_11970 [bacterium]